MGAKVKIRIEAVKQLQGILDGLPVVEPEEVTRTAAVRMLVPQLHAMQSKGYTLTAIARVLGDNGLPLTTVAIKSILAEGAGGKKKRTRGKAPAKAAGATEAAPSGRSSVAEARPAQAPERVPVARGEAAGELLAASNGSAEGRTRGSVLAGPPGPAPRPPAESAAAGAERRSSFVPRSDSDDI